MGLLSRSSIFREPSNTTARPAPPKALSSLLDQAEENDDIEAVVLRVDSGGGTATAGEEMAEYVKRFSKPVVVSSASMNCSAAYEISSQADLIYVNKTTDIGAIGTVMQVTDLSELLGKLGIKVDNIASAESKDSSYGTRPLTDEERAYYQELIDVTNEVFVENVAEGRSMSLDAARAPCDGPSGSPASRLSRTASPMKWAFSMTQLRRPRNSLISVPTTM